MLDNSKLQIVHELIPLVIVSTIVISDISDFDGVVDGADEVEKCKMDCLGYLEICKDTVIDQVAKDFHPDCVLEAAN